ncbi:MAG TPA: class I SAM-dependent methyltransferase [Bryobacteraceae bacterium]|nr:class I SAM-dependent methyltransferase [Bryobacteraceae bacterium]
MQFHALEHLVRRFQERSRIRLLSKMARDWDERARKNARHYIATGRDQWSDEAFFESGRKTVCQDIVTDLENICQGKSPSTMRIIEIGCGAARLTSALAEMFGEVHAVDVSGEMVALAQTALTGKTNAYVYQNNGCDLSTVPALEFDFAYSNIVFQHIPSRQVIDSYVKDVYRLLRPGSLFKFQVQGIAGRGRPDDTWHGVSFSEEQAKDMAERNGFEMRYCWGANTQYFWLWYFKRP